MCFIFPTHTHKTYGIDLKSCKGLFKLKRSFWLIDGAKRRSSSFLFTFHIINTTKKTSVNNMHHKNRIDLDLYDVYPMLLCARHFSTHISSFNPHNNPKREVLLLSPSYKAKHKLIIFLTLLSFF